MKREFDTIPYIKQLKKGANYFNTILNHKDIAAGIILLKPKQDDTQAPHDSDEIYYIVRGDGFLKIKDKDYKISAGKMFFVEKNAQHYFHSNTKELLVVYFFGSRDI